MPHVSHTPSSLRSSPGQRGQRKRRLQRCSAAEGPEHLLSGSQGAGTPALGDNSALTNRGFKPGRPSVPTAQVILLVWG